MTLTSGQLAILKADILANPDLNSNPNTSDGNDTIRILYNINPQVDFWVWKTSISIRTLMGDPGFDWTRVDNLTIGKARIWEWLVMGGSLDASQANVRGGFAACFSAAGDAATLAALLAASRRKATRLEKLFATGTGSTASPAIMTLEGSVTDSDIETARNG